MALLGLLVACAQPPTGADRAGPVDPEGGFAEVYDRLEGLESDERRKKLVELAQREGALTVYTSNTVMEKVVEAFSEKFDVPGEVYRAQSQVVSQRAHTEARAGRVGSDVIDNTAEYMRIAQQEGVVAQYRGPVRDTLPDIALGTGFTANQYTVFAVSWNPETVPSSERPASYEDLTARRWKRRLLIDPRHDAMYFALHQHFTERGWSKRRIRQLFRRLGANAVHMEGGTPRANSVVSGEHDASLGSFIHEVDELAKSGAPIAWEPPVEPVYVEPVGSGLAAGAAHPAAALLFYEWIVTEGQEELASHSRVTHADLTSSGRLGGLRLLRIDDDRYVREREKWQREFHELIGYR